MGIIFQRAKIAFIRQGNQPMIRFVLHFRFRLDDITVFEIRDDSNSDEANQPIFDQTQPLEKRTKSNRKFQWNNEKKKNFK